LVGDEDVEAVIHRQMAAGYRKDLLELGLLEDQLPRNSDQLANLHRAARVAGKKVRTTRQLLDAAAEGYVAKFGKPGTKITEPPARVAVDRTVRRQTIPASTPRASAPPAAPAAASAPKPRSQTIAEMREARKGRVIA
jgi:hypothetical protein